MLSAKLGSQIRVALLRVAYAINFTLAHYVLFCAPYILRADVNILRESRARVNNYFAPRTCRMVRSKLSRSKHSLWP